MAEINGSVGYDAGGAGSGIGAAVFTPNQRDLSTINADWNKQNAQDAADADAAEKARVRDAKSLIGDVDVNTKGILDSDANYFRERAGDIVGRYGQLYAKYQGNPNSPEALLEKGRLDAEKTMLRNEAIQSAGHKEEVIKAANILDADKAGIYDFDKSKLLLAQMRAAPNIQERQKLIDANGGSLLVQAPLSLSKELSKGVGGPSGLQPDVTTNTTEIDPATGRPAIVTKKGYSPDQLGLYALSRYNSDERVKKAANDEFAVLADKNPIQAKTYIDLSEKINDQAIKDGKPQNMRTPQQLFAANTAVNEHAYNQQSQKYGPESEATKEYWWQRRQQYKQAHPNATADDYVYDQMANTIQGDRNAWANFQYNPDGTGIAQGSIYDDRGAGTIKLPKMALKQDASGAWVPTPTGGYEDKPNKIRYTQGEYDKSSDGTLFQKNAIYVDDAALIKAGIDPNDISGNVISQPNPLDPTKTIQVPMNEFVKQHPEITKPLTRQVADNVVQTEKLKINRANHYEKANAYESKSPSIEKATNVHNEKTAPPVTTPQKTQTATKKISTTKLKSLIGTKGYEGYDFDALRKYYEDNGYKVE